MRATRTSSLTGAAVVAAVALAVAAATLLVPTLEASFGGRSASRITATWSASSVTLGKPATVRGRVTSRPLHRRSVSLYVQLKSGWRRVAGTTSDTRGGYVVRVPTGYYYSRPMQLRVSTTRRAKPVTSATRSFSVRPSYRPAGRASSWAPFRRGVEQRLDPCRLVTYRVNGASTAGLSDLQGAFRRLTQATGIRFRYLGRTAAVPSPSAASRAAWPRDSTLVVGWVKPTQTTLRLGGPAGYEIFSQSVVTATHTARDGHGPVRRVTRAGVVLDATQKLGSGFGQMHGRILMHELAHVLGLGEVSDKTQRMNAVVPATATGTGTAWGAGDLAGLARVGLVEGCVTDSRG